MRLTKTPRKTRKSYMLGIIEASGRRPSKQRRRSPGREMGFIKKISENILKGFRGSYQNHNQCTAKVVGKGKGRGLDHTALTKFRNSRSLQEKMPPLSGPEISKENLDPFSRDTKRGEEKRARRSVVEKMKKGKGHQKQEGGLLIGKGCKEKERIVSLQRSRGECSMQKEERRSDRLSITSRGQERTKPNVSINTPKNSVRSSEIEKKNPGSVSYQRP